MERERLIQERREFVAGMGVLFPFMSDGMIAKCWRETAILPPNYRTSLTRDILRAGEQAMKQREDLRKIAKKRKSRK